MEWNQDHLALLMNHLKSIWTITVFLLEIESNLKVPFNSNKWFWKMQSTIIKKVKIINPKILLRYKSVNIKILRMRSKIYK
jgi:hypothetical protein